MKTILVTLIVFFALNSHACSCWGKSGTESHSDVFIGKVLKIELGKYSNKITMKVVKVFQGNYKKGKQIKVLSNLHAASCGFRFKENLTYAVYSNMDNLGFGAVSRCSKTKLLFPVQRFIYRAKKGREKDKF